MRRQHLGRADAGELQQHRGADGAGGQHDLAAGGGDAVPAIVTVGDACAATLVERHARHRRPGADEEVRPGLDRLQEGFGGMPADAAALVHMEIAAAFVVAAVEIVGLGDARLRRGFTEGVEDRPSDARRLDPPLAAGTVEVVVTDPALVVVAGAAVVVERVEVVVEATGSSSLTTRKTTVPTTTTKSPDRIQAVRFIGAS